MSIDRKQVEQEFHEAAARRAPMADGPAKRANGAWIKDDYDDKQRAHMLEIGNDGPAEGLVQTDLVPDLGGEADAEPTRDDEDALDSTIDTNRPVHGESDDDT